jgi:hypothetical protein
MISLPPDSIPSSELKIVESEEDLQLGNGRQLYDLRLISMEFGETFISQCLSCESNNYLYARVWDKPGRYSKPKKIITSSKTFQTSNSVK